MKGADSVRARPGSTGDRARMTRGRVGTNALVSHGPRQPGRTDVDHRRRPICISRVCSRNERVERDDRWQNLVTGAFHLDDELGSVRARGSVARRRLAVEYLDSILEVFPSDLDPVEDFEGYAVRRLAQSLRRALHEAGTPPPARLRARPPRRAGS